MNKHGRTGIKRTKPAPEGVNRQSHTYQVGYREGLAQGIKDCEFIDNQFLRVLRDKKRIKDIQDLIDKRLPLTR